MIVVSMEIVYVRSAREVTWSNSSAAACALAIVALNPIAKRPAIGYVVVASHGRVFNRRSLRHRVVIANQRLHLCAAHHVPYKVI
jgi:hypothetical protein